MLKSGSVGLWEACVVVWREQRLDEFFGSPDWRGGERHC